MDGPWFWYLVGCCIFRRVMADYPWTFDNDMFGGPEFWNFLHKDWRMCADGQLQSPVNIDPSRLLFDPSLQPLRFSHKQVEAQLRNTGQLPIISLNDTESTIRHLNITGGPASPYTYRLNHIAFHFGRSTENERGSEHTIDRTRFPAEIQLMAFNSDLYENFTEAMTQPHGILAIAIIVDIGENPNAELRRMTIASQSITFKDMHTKLHKFKPFDLVPKTDHFVTYEGSLTQPGCYETVTWVIFNLPIYIGREDMSIWDSLQQVPSTNAANPAFMSPNYRPLKPLNGRLFRTNINVKYKNRSPQGSCPSVYVDVGYRANPKRIHLANLSVSEIDSFMKKQRRDVVNLNEDLLPGENRYSVWSPPWSKFIK